MIDGATGEAMNPPRAVGDMSGPMLDDLSRDAGASLREPVPAPPDLGSAYEVLRELGRGGMAIVYLARERATGRELAVKVIHARFVGDAEAVARFMREARLVARVAHPNIVPIHSVQELDNGALALVMDRVPGRTVKEIIRDRGPMPPGHVQRILDDVAAALGAAHAEGIVHRDVKPENIFIDETTGRALLSDFGIARSIESDTQLTMAGVAIGTPTYMAPEAIEGAALDGRADLYSLGLVGWEMLTGRRPWEGESLYGIIYRQRHDELEPIDTLRSDVPMRLVAAVEGLLAKNPANRWPDAATFREQLTATGPVVRRPRAQPRDVHPSDDTIAFRRSRFIHDPRKALGRAAAVAGVALVVSATLLFARPEGAPRAWMRAVTHTAPPASRATLPQRSPGSNGSIGDGAVAVPGASALVTAPATDSLGVSAAMSAGVANAASIGHDSALSHSVPVPPPAVVGAPVPAPSIATTVRDDASDNVVVRHAPPVASVAAAAPERAGSRFAIVTGASDTCILGAEGAAYCWGSNTEGQLGVAGAGGGPSAVTGGLRFATIAPGLSHTCALTSGGTAYCWGSNDRGELGDGGSSAHAVPTRVAGGRSFSTIVAGAEHSCALTGDGRAYCWGAGAHGELGNGSTGDRASPVPVSGNVRFARIVSGWHHSCGITDAGAAYCWGANESGEIGDGTTASRSSPTAVRTSARFVTLAAGSAHTCGVTSSGAVLCWGANRYGQLGDGSTATRTVPVSVDRGDRFVAIATGGVHTCALTRDHAAWCWGRNNYGQLGDGSGGDHSHPVQVAGDHAFVTVSAFGAHTCGTTTTDELFCWGYNLDGQLGDGTREHRYRPVYVEKPAG